MARLARVVVPGIPYHVTHRGNRRDAIFYDNEDREVYLALLNDYGQRHGLALWAYCLMTNHVHLLVVPGHEKSMAEAIGRTHMRYARWLNKKRGWCGHLWANRYYSTALDENHLWTAARYVEANPLRARMVVRAEHYPWSSCAVHCGAAADAAGLLHTQRPFPGHLDRNGWTNGSTVYCLKMRLNCCVKTRQRVAPGGVKFIELMEERLNRILKKQKPGPKPKVDCDNRTPDLFGGLL